MTRFPIFVGVVLMGAGLAAPSALAQFGTIFNDPPRPPSNIPARPPAPAPLGLPQQMPPEEMDDDAQPPPPVARTQPQPMRPPSPSQVPGAIRSQPLPPPPGAAPVDTQQSALPRPPGLQPGQPAAPPVGQPAVATPGQPLRGTPQPANTAPQPGDEVVTEMPSQKIANPTAVFAGLDKITGRIISFDVALNETVQFGALQVTPRVCYTRPPTETANTDSFVDVNEVTLQGEVKRIFTGWMFAASPGLHAVEHPIYDVWLTDCKGGTAAVADTQPTAPVTPQRPAAGQPRTSTTTSATTTASPQRPAAPSPRSAVQQPTLQQPQPQLTQPPQSLSAPPSSVAPGQRR